MKPVDEMTVTSGSDRGGLRGGLPTVPIGPVPRLKLVHRHSNDEPLDVQEMGRPVVFDGRGEDQMPHDEQDNRHVPLAHQRAPSTTFQPC